MRPDSERVWQERVQSTGRSFLRGREEADDREANVFGNGRFTPLAQARDKELWSEVQVRYCHSQFTRDARGDIDESAEVYQYRLILWHNAETGPEPDVLYNWEDCLAHDGTGDDWGWGRLLREAIDRVGSIQAGCGPFEPCVVGMPPTETGRVVTVSDAAARDVVTWVTDIARARAEGTLERQLKRKKRALARRLLQSIGMGDRDAVGAVALGDCETALKGIGKAKRWPKAKLERALLDLKQGFGYYRQELREKRDHASRWY